MPKAKPKKVKQTTRVVHERRHKAKTVAIKTAEVDVKIIPLIQWLNEFEGVFTRWSCEGSSRKGNVSYPGYVSFYVENQYELANVIDELTILAHKVKIPVPQITVDREPDTFGYLRFSFHMSRSKMLRLAAACSD